MLYVCSVPAQGAAAPVIVPGCTGTVLGVTATRLLVEVPQPFAAVTVMFPAAVPTIAGIEAVVEVPFQPAGSVQL